MMRAPLPDGGRLEYEIRGEGMPLLLIPPLVGSTHTWGRFADMLAGRAQVIAFDPRGMGDSSPAPFFTTTRGMARDALALIDHLGIERAHIYGISLGGMVASWLAVDAPKRVDRLVLASTLPRGLEISRAHAASGITIATCLFRTARDAQSCMATRVLSPSFRDANPEEVRRLKKSAKKNSASSRDLQAIMAATAMHDIRSRLRDIKAETLLLFGENDMLLTFESQVELMRGIPNAGFRVINGAGHDISIEAPAETAARVLEHIKAP
jgi:3-oxoadipate enol-lactonase